MTYPPWIELFRSPVRVLWASELPALVNAAVCFVAFVFAGPSSAVLWVLTHLLFVLYTRRIRRRYGVRGATAREQELLMSFKARVAREWQVFRDHAEKGDS